MDAFFRATPARVWEEFKIANTIIDSYDAWRESVRNGNKKPWRPPEFKAKSATGRRRLSGGAY